jgi:hypothetical protein
MLNEEFLAKWFDILTEEQRSFIAKGDAIRFCQSVRSETGDLGLALRIYKQLREILT